MRLCLGLMALNHMTHCWLYLCPPHPPTPHNEAIAHWGTGAIHICLSDFITFSSCQRFASPSTWHAWKNCPSKFDYSVTESFMVALPKKQWEETAGQMNWGQADVCQMCKKKTWSKSHRCAWVSPQWAVQACLTDFAAFTHLSASLRSLQMIKGTKVNVRQKRCLKDDVTVTATSAVWKSVAHLKLFMSGFKNTMWQTNRWHLSGVRYHIEEED